ncbi:MAG: hypothetical protein L0I33_01535 [Acetobacter sp.]|nr:hypothetical protein [Acetobacter sp.]
MAADIKLKIYGRFDRKWALDLLVLPVFQHLTAVCVGPPVWHASTGQQIRFRHTD